MTSDVEKILEEMMDTVVKQYLERFEVSEATRRFLGKTHKMFIGGAGSGSSGGRCAAPVRRWRMATYETA
jgi:hypothetical protein